MYARGATEYTSDGENYCSNRTFLTLLLDSSATTEHIF